ncbi:hypothetical protein V501_00993 [Pseudogymnoascus sp. VKM F-4519 (FW-2642)]|nr:hypothetical protein V501_00993 [Pseudogymnoascus sp. VKM F-4519 (FW-2642)]
MTQTEHEGCAPLPTPESTASYWHKEPSKILLNHRTTEDLPPVVDVVVVGSGIVGAFAAWRLLQDAQDNGLSGARSNVQNVLMLEAREACWGATGRNGGHCQPKLFGQPPHISRFELENYTFLKSFIKENNIPCDWETVEGCKSFYSKAMFDMAISDSEASAKLDPELGKLMTPIRPGDANPSLKDVRLGSASLGALVQKPAASLWPYKLVAWMLEQLLERNGSSPEVSFNLQTKTPVTHIQSLADGRWMVHTDRGMVTANKVLLATNAYTSHLLPHFSDLIVPVQGQMSSLIPPPSISPHTGKPLSYTNSYGFLGNKSQNSNQDDYLVQRPFREVDGKFSGGELMFGGGRGQAAILGMGVADDTTIDKAVAHYLRTELNNELDLDNDNTELKASYEWTGIMGFSRDGRPWCGEVPTGMGGGEGLFICAGFTGHGMPTTSLSAKYVADLMMGKQESDVKIPKEIGSCGSIFLGVLVRFCSVLSNVGRVGSETIEMSPEILNKASFVDLSPLIRSTGNMPQDKIQGELALDMWKSMYKEKTETPTMIVQQIIEHHKVITQEMEEIAKEEIAMLQAQLNDAQKLAAQRAKKIKSLKMAAKLLVAGPPKETESAPSTYDPPQDPSKETWEATMNNIGATIHLLDAEELYQKGDIRGLVEVAQNAVTCAAKQLDTKLLADAWIWLGTGYCNRANLKSGVQAFNMALEVLKALDQKDKEVESMKKLVETWQSDIKEPEAKFSALLLKIQSR